MRLKFIVISLAFGLGLLAFLVGWGLAPARADSTTVMTALLPAASGNAAVEYDIWQLAADAPFAFTRFDAEYSLTTGHVYSNTDGSVWEFDPVTGVYTDTGVDMPVPISNYQIARLVEGGGDEVLVVFGGRPAAGGVVNTVQGYKPGTNTTVDYSGTDPYPVLTAPGGVAVVDNVAYVFGGFDGVATISDTYIFDITATPGSRFTAGPAINQPRSYIANAVVDGVIYAMGGDDFDGAALLPLTITEKLDTASPTAWDDAGVVDLPIACDETQAFGFDSASGYDLNNAVVIAGCGQWPNEIAEGLLYDVGTNSWDQGFPDINLARRNHAGAFIPVSYGTVGLPSMWIWGGRQGADTNVLITPEFYNVTTDPRASFTHNGPIALGETAVFTNTSTGTEPLTYLWDFGDGITSTLTSPTHTYAATDTYTVMLEVTNIRGSDTATDTIQVVVAPTASFTHNGPILLGETAVFTNTSTGTEPLTYLWDFGDGITSTLTSPTHTYAVADTYTVMLAVTNVGGSDTATDTFQVIMAPTASFTHNGPIMLGETAVFTNTSTGTEPLTFLWDFGDGITSTLDSPTHTYTAADIYTVTLEASNTAGSNIAMAEFVVETSDYKIYLPIILKP